eukprot:6495009-Pyramimonas_sp.AAC.1
MAQNNGLGPPGGRSDTGRMSDMRRAHAAETALAIDRAAGVASNIAGKNHEKVKRQLVAPHLLES